MSDQGPRALDGERFCALCANRDGETCCKVSGYAVGYGRPPKQHQFKPGQSGNPSGRSKKKPAATLPLPGLRPMTVDELRDEYGPPPALHVERPRAWERVRTPGQRWMFL